MNQETSRTLTVITDTGLSNRIRVLLSGIALAEATNRRFRMEWVPARTCGCTFHQLFENNWNVQNARTTSQALDLTRIPWHTLPDLTQLPEPEALGIYPRGTVSISVI